MPDEPADPPEPKKTFRREDDPDPRVRAGGAFPTEDTGEWKAWGQAFDEAEPDDAPPADTPSE